PRRSLSSKCACQRWRAGRGHPRELRPTQPHCRAVRLGTTRPGCGVEAQVRHRDPTGLVLARGVPVKAFLVAVSITTLPPIGAPCFRAAGHRFESYGGSTESSSNLNLLFQVSSDGVGRALRAGGIVVVRGTRAPATAIRGCCGSSTARLCSGPCAGRAL